MENPPYKRNFLTEVIVKIDFAVPIPEIEETLPDTLVKSIIKNFPVSQPQKGYTDQVEVSENSLSRKREEFTDWTFFGYNRKKFLKLSKMRFLISYSSYESFRNLSIDFFEGVSGLFSQYPTVIINRLGLRYINNIRVDGDDPLDWDGYINKTMTQMLTIYPDKTNISRGFQILEYNFGDYFARFQFGMHNPDYPSRILKKLFVIDTDIYQQGLIEQKNLPSILESFHDKAFRFFELSIDNKLRDIMNAE